MKFSVIIPNYNNGATLARAINSVIDQSYPAHEIIVIDDGSTDNSRDVIASFADRIRYIHQKNSGVSVARNKGAAEATGDWLAFLDADDFFYPNRLAVHAAWLERAPDCDFLLADQEVRTADGKLKYMSLAGASIDALRKNSLEREIPILHDDFGGLIADGIGEVRTLSVPRETFLRLGGFPTDRKIGEDFYFVVRLYADSQKAGIVDTPVAIYYIYPTSALRVDVLGSQENYVDTLKALAPFIPDHDTALRRGYHEKLRRARLELAYALLRKSRKLDAIKSVWRSFLATPSTTTCRDLLAIVRGMK